jgi:glycosyltransferase involved in cell wall biosynthesis
MPDIAVVIPAYNAASYLKETVASVVASLIVKTEIVIVDDGSTDNTFAVANEIQVSHPNLVRAIQQTNAGVAVARNTGFAHTSAPFVCFLDADDRLRPNALVALKGLLERDRRCIASYGNVAYIDQESKPLALQASRSLRPSGDLLAHILEGNLTDTPGAVLFRSSAVKQAGGFRAGLRRSQDWEFYVRMAQQGTIAACDQIVLDYRIHPQSLSHEGSTASTFEEALSLAFSGVQKKGLLSTGLLKRLEARRRASTLRFIAIRSHSLSLPTFIGMLRLCLSSGFDMRVLRITLRTIISAAKTGLLANLRS